MDQVTRYRSIVKRILAEHAEQIPSHGKIETLPLFNDSHDNYAVLDLGWDRMGRVHAVILHIRLKNGKIWIEQDGTEAGVAAELLDAEFPKKTSSSPSIAPNAARSQNSQLPEAINSPCPQTLYRTYARCHFHVVRRGSRTEGFSRRNLACPEKIPRKLRVPPGRGMTLPHEFVNY